MIGYVIAVFGWNIYWIVEDLIKKRNYLDRYNVKENGWLSVIFWVFTLSGVGVLIFYCA
jgi:hypothetical protein